MTYFVSDIHGEYELFCSLLDKIHFTDRDTMYVCGDILEKGDGSLRLLKLISSMKSIHCVMGNHDRNFIKFYHTIMEKSPTDFDVVLNCLREFFFDEDGELTWDMVDYLESMPYYIETDDFVCVHAGVELDESKNIVPLNAVSEELLIFDRRFKDDDVIHNSKKCVFYGHTVAENGKITAYKRQNAVSNSIKDFYKIHLDTGAWQNGILGCFCLESLECTYVKK